MTILIRTRYGNVNAKGADLNCQFENKKGPLSNLLFYRLKIACFLSFKRSPF